MSGFAEFIRWPEPPGLDWRGKWRTTWASRRRGVHTWFENNRRVRTKAEAEEYAEMILRHLRRHPELRIELRSLEVQHLVDDFQRESWLTYVEYL